MMGNVFNKYFLNDFIDVYRTKLSKEVDNLEITESTNINQLVDRFKMKYTIHPLSLGEVLPSEPRETTIERRNDWGDMYDKKVFEIDITLPFVGTCALFDCHPSISTVVFLDKNVRIGENIIKAKIILEDLDSDNFNSQIRAMIGYLSSNIPQINTEIAPWNNGLDSYITQLLELRKGLVSKKFDFMEKIGLKVNSKSTDFMIPNPVTRKSIPVPVTETAKNVRKDIIPILQEEVYKDIKDVLYNVGKAIERKPSIYLGKYEEDLRDVFLLFLETRYESTSGVGEAFNKKGKTDILLKYSKDGTNLFVAECKFWKGQKKLHEGLDQLLGYLTHRDSKTALILFVNQKEFSAVLSSVKGEMKNHAEYKGYIGDTYENSISYEFKLPDDSQKIIQLEVILFHFPAIK
jgi:hypothetical protein